MRTAKQTQAEPRGWNILVAVGADPVTFRESRVGQHHVCVNVAEYGFGFAEGLVSVNLVVHAGVRPLGQAVPG